MNKRIRRKKGLLDPKVRTTGPTKYRGRPPSPERLASMLEGTGAHVDMWLVDAEWREVVDWLKQWLRGGHMHREEDWMPEP